MDCDGRGGEGFEARLGRGLYLGVFVMEVQVAITGLVFTGVRL